MLSLMISFVMATVSILNSNGKSRPSQAIHYRSPLSRGTYLRPQKSFITKAHSDINDINDINDTNDTDSNDVNQNPQSLESDFSLEILKRTHVLIGTLGPTILTVDRNRIASLSPVYPNDLSYEAQLFWSLPLSHSYDNLFNCINHHYKYTVDLNRILQVIATLVLRNENYRNSETQKFDYEKLKINCIYIIDYS